MSKLVEEWRPVVGYEGLYEVSDWGRVKSLGMKQIGRNQYGNEFIIYKKGKTLKSCFDRDGYLIVSLHDANHKQKACKVHRLVAEAFLPNPENKPVVGHLKTMENGLEDKTANEAWNIAWMTLEENANYGTLPERLSEMHKGENCYMYGKHHSEETKKKMSSNNKNCKKVLKYSMNDELLDAYNSIHSAAKSIGCSHSGIRNCCKGIYKQFKGYKWKFAI